MTFVMNLREARRSNDFLPKVPLSGQKNRRYAKAHLRNPGKKMG